MYVSVREHSTRVKQPAIPVRTRQKGVAKPTTGTQQSPHHLMTRCRRPLLRKKSIDFYFQKSIIRHSKSAAINYKSRMQLAKHIYLTKLWRATYRNTA